MRDLYETFTRESGYSITAGAYLHQDAADNFDRRGLTRERHNVFHDPYWYKKFLRDFEIDELVYDQPDLVPVPHPVPDPVPNPDPDSDPSPAPAPLVLWSTKRMKPEIAREKKYLGGIGSLIIKDHDGQTDIVAR